MDICERIQSIIDEIVDDDSEGNGKDVDVLEALKNVIKEAARCIEDIADRHDLGDRAHVYCVAQLLTACDNDHSYLGGGTFTVQDLADAVSADQNEDDPDASEAEADHSDDVCTCGDPDCNRPNGHAVEEEVQVAFEPGCWVPASSISSMKKA